MEIQDQPPGAGSLEVQGVEDGAVHPQEHLLEGPGKGKPEIRRQPLGKEKEVFLTASRKNQDRDNEERQHTAASEAVEESRHDNHRFPGNE
jgi:hypothetical protein